MYKSSGKNAKVVKNLKYSSYIKGNNNQCHKKETFRQYKSLDWGSFCLIESPSPSSIDFPTRQIIKEDMFDFKNQSTTIYLCCVV